MKQQYFVVVLAHSLHGRLQRIHVPHKAIYTVVCLLLLGSLSLFGFVSSYMRMTWKISNYNTLRDELEVLRNRYHDLQRDARQAEEQLATLQLHASEVSVALGIKRRMNERGDLGSGGRLVPTISESLDEYNLLKSANFSRLHRTYARRWQTNTVPSIWPINGRLSSYFGSREDPFSGAGDFHPGVDISAPQGTLVRSTADGVVILAEWSGAYGKLVVVEHSAGFHTYYAHLSRFDVVAGQEVRRGETVGRSGATGRVTSPHLHYEVRRNGDPINPYRYLKTELAQGVSSDLPL